MGQNAFDILETKYKKEFNIVYRRLSYQMLYGEAEILLMVLRKETLITDYEIKLGMNFIFMLGKNYEYNYSK